MAGLAGYWVGDLDDTAIRPEVRNVTLHGAHMSARIYKHLDEIWVLSEERRESGHFSNMEEWNMSPGGLSEKQKQKGEMKKKKLRFSSRGSLRCYGPRSLVDEAIWLQAFKKIKKRGKIRNVRLPLFFCFVPPPAVESHLFSSLIFWGLSLWSDSSFLTPASFSTRLPTLNMKRK